MFIRAYKTTKLSKTMPSDIFSPAAELFCLQPLLHLPEINEINANLNEM